MKSFLLLFLFKSSPFVQVTTCVKLLKENLFCSNIASEIYFLTPDVIISSQPIARFLFEINREDIGISKLISQSKLLPSLFELKDNDTVVMSTIIKELQDMSQNRSFLRSEVGKIVRLFLLSQATNAESDDIFFALKRVNTYLMSTMGNNRLHALILVHVHKSILDNMNLADVAKEFVDKRDSRKQSSRHFSQNHS